MLESEINLNNISNLKHRAILQALLTTELPVNAISRKLQCTSGAIYYCIKRYLYKGFSENRNKKIQMNQLSSCAQREPKESLTGTDVVTEVKLLPKADSKFKALPSKETQEVFHDSNMESEYNNSDDSSEPQVKKNPLTPIQQRIYDFITDIIQKYKVPYVPRLNKVYFLYKNTYGIGFARRDFYMARKKWLAEHGPTGHENSSLHNSNTEGVFSREIIKTPVRLNPSSSFQAHILKIEYQGLKLSLDLDEHKVCMDELTTLFKTVLKI